MAIWGEVCVRDQVLLYDNQTNNKFTSPYKIQIPNILEKDSKPYIVSVPGPGKLLEALQLIESVEGLPFSKTMIQAVLDDNGEVVGVK